MARTKQRPEPEGWRPRWIRLRDIRNQVARIRAQDEAEGKEGKTEDEDEDEEDENSTSTHETSPQVVPLSAYEVNRLENIERNQRYLHSLNISPLPLDADGPAAPAPDGDEDTDSGGESQGSHSETTCGIGRRTRSNTRTRSSNRGTNAGRSVGEVGDEEEEEGETPSTPSPVRYRGSTPSPVRGSSPQWPRRVSTSSPARGSSPPWARRVKQRRGPAPSLRPEDEVPMWDKFVLPINVTEHPAIELLT
jgi:hypothetical protein